MAELTDFQGCGEVIPTFWNNGGTYFQHGLDFEYPPGENKSIIDVPLIGKFGFDLKLLGSFDYTPQDGEWEVELGFNAGKKIGKSGRRPKFPLLTRYPRPKLYIGNREPEISVSGKASGTATATRGIVFDQFAVSARYKEKLELTRYGLFDVFPVIGAAIDRIKFIDRERFETIVIFINGTPEIAGELQFEVDPEFAFKQAELEVGLAIEAAMHIKAFGTKTKIWAGGKGTGYVDIPDLEEIRGCLRASVGIDVEAWIFEYHAEYGYEHCWSTADQNNKRLLPPTTPPTSEFTGLVPRTYQHYGPQASTPKNTKKSKSNKAAHCDADTATTVQNIAAFSSSDIASAPDGTRLVLFVKDNPALPQTQSTDIAFSHFDGTSWTSPANVTTDTRAEFHPKVTFLADGDAIAVWERIKATAHTSEDIADFTPQLEIVSARWQKATNTWTAPVAITDNTVLDHSPRLASPHADGTIRTVWAQKPDSASISTQGAPSHLLESIWNPATQSWSSPATVAANLPALESFALHTHGDTDRLAWVAGTDPTPDAPESAELFTSTATATTWTPPTRLTTDTEPDHAVTLATTPDGVPYFVWLRGQQAVTLTGTTGQIEPLPIPETESATTIRTASADGKTILFWEKMTERSPKIYVAVHDPATSSWSAPSELDGTEALQSDLSITPNADGTVTALYHETAVTLETRMLTNAEGQPIEVENIPTPARTDLKVSTLTLGRNVAATPDTLQLTTGDLCVGSQSTLEVKVSNCGPVQEPDVSVAFYLGDPATGGTEIGRHTFENPIPGYTETTATLDWQVTDTAAAPLFAVIDPDNTVPEATETDNATSLATNTTDASLRLTYSHASEGTLTIRALVKNEAILPTPQLTVDLRCPDGVRATATIPPLTSGSEQEVEFTTDETTLPEGDSLCYLELQIPAAWPDADDENNTVRFPHHYFRDEDGDLLPTSWELANNLDPNNPDDADQDPDHDGRTTINEWRAGTDPNDASSILAISEVQYTSTQQGDSIILKWPSVERRAYRIEELTKSGTHYFWSPVTEGIPSRIEATPPENNLTIPISGEANERIFRILPY